MEIFRTVTELVHYALERGLIEKEDRIYCTNRLLEMLRLGNYTETEIPSPARELEELLREIDDYAYENGIIPENTVTYRDLFDTDVMGIFVDRPSNIQAKFRDLYSISPKNATDWFYRLACDSDYIRTYRIKKDVKWVTDSEYGKIDITINLSKPEKDPKDIAAAKLVKASGYPKCALCRENEGYAGSVSSAARQNIRVFSFDMAGTEWFLQYSPYVYYNEHCIAVNRSHVPMKIDRSTFEKLLCFIEKFPHYFIGSNADLPIVGGSILSHDHMQGGRYTFAMERAPIEKPLTFRGYEGVTAGIVKWPMSAIRISGKSKDELVSLADKILRTWRGYSDPDAFIFAETDGEPHNTITPIARRRGDDFELDLVLRNNITTEEYPLGVFHPHKELHNIKKENIGLIEVMGLAVLPSRLKSEIAYMKAAILDHVDFNSIENIKKHRDWFETFKDKYDFTEENTESIIMEEIGKTFVRVLEDAGVYKCTPAGRAAFLRFTDKVNSD